VIKSTLESQSSGQAKGRTGLKDRLKAEKDRRDKEAKEKRKIGIE
jgi:hypothetical protein